MKTSNFEFLNFGAFIRLNEIDEFAKLNGWYNIDYSQIKSIMDNISSMTVNLIDLDKKESYLDKQIEDEHDYLIYGKECKFDFNRACTFCFLNQFKILHTYNAYDDMRSLVIDRLSLKPFFNALVEKYDVRLITLLYSFVFFEFTITKRNLDLLKSWTIGEDCEYEGAFYHCFRCENLKGDYPCINCDKNTCFKCLYEYISN